MTLRLLSDAAAQTTVSGAITAVQTSIVGQSTANFPVPAASQQVSMAILDSGNPAFNAATPLATPYEYVVYTTNTVGTNTISGITRGQASTTAKAFFAGATIAVPLLAEDIVASAPWKFAEIGPLGLAQATMDFSNIPASYLGISWRKLTIDAYLRGTTAATNTDLFLNVNGDSGTNYDNERGFFAGTSGTQTVNATDQVNGTNADLGFISAGNAYGNAFSAVHAEIPLYANTVGDKSIIAQIATLTGIALNSKFVVWSSNFWHPVTPAAINRIVLSPAAGSFAIGSWAAITLGP